MLEHLYVKSAVNDDEAVLKLLRNMVPEYDPGQPTGPAAAATSDRAPYPDGF
jgi:hypothetical protein